jgi:hypothetical protein
MAFVTRNRRNKHAACERRNRLRCRDCGEVKPSAGPDFGGRCETGWGRAVHDWIWSGLKVNTLRHASFRGGCSHKWSTDLDDDD